LASQLCHLIETRDECNVAKKVETEFFVKRRVDSIRRRDEEERIAIWRGLHDRLGRDIATSARTVLHDELLAKPLRQPLAHEPGDNVARAAGSKADNDPHRPRRIGLPACDARYHR